MLLGNCRLDTDAKNAEILRLLPLMAPFTMEFTTMQQSLDTAVTRLEQVQVRPLAKIFRNRRGRKHPKILYRKKSWSKIVENIRNN